MATRLVLGKVLERAIEKEIHSQQLYANLSQKVIDQAAKDVLKILAQQEKGHQDILEQYQRGELKEGALSSGYVVDYRIAEHLDQPELIPDMRLEDIFLLAANREKASHELYLGLAQIHPPGRVKKLLEKLAGQELEHKQRVEFLYTEVAFPQTSGG